MIADRMDEGRSFTAAESPYSKLYDLTSAALRPGAISYNLSLSILLNGARGIGKFTTIAKVAQDLGIHVLEVGDFTVVRDIYEAENPTG